MVPVMAVTVVIKSHSEARYCGAMAFLYKFLAGRRAEESIK